MNIETTIEKIIHLPHVFKRIGTKSVHSLLKDTGYFEMADQIHEENIINALQQFPDCIAEWKQFSEDKRTSSGWYFYEIEGKRFVVGNLDPIKVNNLEVEFSDIIKACAFYIKHEIENIRRLGIV